MILTNKLLLYKRFLVYVFWFPIILTTEGVLGGCMGEGASLACGLCGVRTFSRCSSPRTLRLTAAQSRKHVAITFPVSLKDVQKWLIIQISRALQNS